MPTFLCGHGNWYPKDGYTRVPGGSKITFYTQNIKTLYQQEAFKILDGTTQFDPARLDVYEALSGVPEMTLSDAGSEFRMKCEAAVKGRTGAWKLVFADEGKPRKLSEIFKALPGEELVWVACREVRLKKVIGKVGGTNTVVGPQIGVNVRENPTTLYSAYIVGGSGRPEAVHKATFRGFMPSCWNVPAK